MNPYRPYHLMNPPTGISPTHRAAWGYRAVVPPGHDGRGVSLSYRALAPNGAVGNPTLFSIQHSTFSIPNWTFTFSATERDSETGYSYFGSRYYSSDLSVWLSVDPQSDKYPSLSPYTYCANNPVRLVDPNGETWETPEDIDLANTLISHAQTMQSKYDPSSFEYQLLQEGINGLINMGSDENTCYTFNNSQTYEGSVSLLDNGTISINYVDIEGEPDSKIGSAWHEAFHLMRRNTYRSYSEDELRNASTTYWGFKNGLLGNNNNINEEYLTYTSQLIFSPKSMPTNEGAKVVDDASIRNYIIKHYGCPSDYVFQFPAP